MSASLFSSKGAGDRASAGCRLSSLSVSSWGPGAKSGSHSRAFSGLLGDTFFWKRLGQRELGGQRKRNTGEMVESYAVWPPRCREASERGILWRSAIPMVFRESTPWPVDIMLVESLVHQMVGCIFMVLMFLCWAVTLASVETSTTSQPDTSHLLGSRVRTLLVPWTVPLNGCVQREVNSSYQL